MTFAHKTLQLALICTAIVHLPAAVGADTYYRWTNSSGVVQISDRPPAPGVPYEEGIMGRGGNFVEAQSGPGADANVSTDRSEPVMAIGDNPGGAPELVKDPVLCENARQNIEALDNFVRIRVQDSDGSYRILSPEEREAEKAKARKTMSINCD